MEKKIEPNNVFINIQIEVRSLQVEHYNVVIWILGTQKRSKRKCRGF